MLLFLNKLLFNYFGSSFCICYTLLLVDCGCNSYFWFIRCTSRVVSWLGLDALASKHHHHCLHHLHLHILASAWNLGSGDSALWVFVCTISSGAIQAKFAFNFGVKIYALITVCARWEIFTLFSWVHIRALIS